MKTFRATKAAREAMAFVPVVSGAGHDRNVLQIVELRSESNAYGRVVGEVELPELRGGYARYAIGMALGSPDPHLFVSGEFSRIWAVPAGQRDLQRIVAGGPYERTGAAYDVAVVDRRTFEITSLRAVGCHDHVPSFDTWCCPRHGLLVTTEACRSELLDQGLHWAALKRGHYGHRIHFFGLEDLGLRDTIDLGAENQMLLRLAAPCHQTSQCYGFVSALVTLPSLGSAVWCWYRDGARWRARKIIQLPPEPCQAELLPPSLAPFGVVPPLITDMKLAPNGRFLYISCWGTGELLQYDVSTPLRPRLTGTVRIGGIVQRFPHPRTGVVDGGPHAIDVSPDGLRIYVTNSASPILDSQFYPKREQGWMAKFDALPHGGMTVDEQFLVSFREASPQDVVLADLRD